MNSAFLAGGIFAIIIGAVFLLIGVQVYGSVDNTFSCDTIHNTNGTATCNTVKSVTWTLLSLAPYGLLLGGIGIIFIGVRM